MYRIGLIINPIAGIGGTAGLKGSDGAQIQKEALARGAKPLSGVRTAEALEILKEKQTDFTFLTCPGEMGEDVLRSSGFTNYLVIGLVEEQCDCYEENRFCSTTGKTTENAVHEMLERGIDILVFAGGDGTARNVLHALETSSGITSQIPVLGIPTGCKIHSGVYGIHPTDTGILLRQLIEGRPVSFQEAEVMDIDEKEFRKGIVRAQLYGYLRVPKEPRYVQNFKSSGQSSEPEEQQALARYLASQTDSETLYLFGTGSTIYRVEKELGIENASLLGVDIWYRGNLLLRDGNEQEIYRILEVHPDVPRKLLVTVIGGQGFLFGRGNQQISARILRKVGKQNLIVTAARQKMFDLRGSSLHIDVNDSETEQEFAGYIRVITAPGEEMVCKIE